MQDFLNSLNFNLQVGLRYEDIPTMGCR